MLLFEFSLHFPIFIKNEAYFQSVTKITYSQTGQKRVKSSSSGPPIFGRSVNPIPTGALCVQMDFP